MWLSVFPCFIFSILPYRKIIYYSLWCRLALVHCCSMCSVIDILILNKKPPNYSAVISLKKVSNEFDTFYCYSLPLCIAMSLNALFLFLSKARRYSSVCPFFSVFGLVVPFPCRDVIIDHPITYQLK